MGRKYLRWQRLGSFDRLLAQGQWSFPCFVFLAVWWSAPTQNHSRHVAGTVRGIGQTVARLSGLQTPSFKKERRKDGRLTGAALCSFSQNISKAFGHLVLAFSAVFHLLKQVRVLLKSTGRNIDSPGRQKRENIWRWGWEKLKGFRARGRQWGAMNPFLVFMQTSGLKWLKWLHLVNGLHLYSAFIQSAVQFKPLIHPFTHTFTLQRRLAAMQGTNQLVRSNWGLGVLLRDTSTCPGWDRTGNPPTARRQLSPPEPYRPISR